MLVQYTHQSVKLSRPEVVLSCHFVFSPPIFNAPSSPSDLPLMSVFIPFLYTIIEFIAGRSPCNNYAPPNLAEMQMAFPPRMRSFPATSCSYPYLDPFPCSDLIVACTPLKDSLYFSLHWKQASRNFFHIQISFVEIDECCQLCKYVRFLRSIVCTIHFPASTTF